MMMDKILEVLKNSRSQISDLGSPTDDVNKVMLSEIDGLIKILERPNPSSEGFYYWTIQVGIAKNWVADGVDFTEVRTHDILAKAFGWMYGHEIKTKVLSRPSNEAVAEEMGFKSVADYLRDRKKE